MHSYPARAALDNSPVRDNLLVGARNRERDPRARNVRESGRLSGYRNENECAVLKDTVRSATPERGGMLR